MDTNNYLCDFIDTFSLTNIVNSKTCFKTLNGTLLDIVLTNKSKSFCKTCTTETGLSDCHKMIHCVKRVHIRSFSGPCFPVFGLNTEIYSLNLRIQSECRKIRTRKSSVFGYFSRSDVTFLRASFKRLPSKTIVCRDYKHFNQNEFLDELDLEMNNGKFSNSTNPYHDFSNLFKEITDKYAPIKQKKVRGNNFPFMTKELRKVIMDRSRLPNKHLKYPSREYFVNMKKMKNKYNSICKKSKIKYLKRITEKGISSKKQFWNVKAFLKNKGCMSNDFISIRNGDTFIDKGSKLVEMFNSHYINIVEKTLGVPTENYVIDTNNTQEIIEGIIRK